MTISLAPMEGITDYLYRKALQRHYGCVDCCYTPFLTPTQNKVFSTREWKEIDPLHNQGLRVIPQLLTRNPEHFLWACRELKALGYDQVNLNLGCPSGTVVSKKKGSGFLSVPQELDCFLQEVFSSADLSISIKTRIGLNDPEEFPALLEIFNRYPLACLIIHPRLRRDFYRGSLNPSVFAYALEQSKNPLCYNGDLFSVQDITAVTKAYPVLNALMLGRGLIANPALPLEYRGTGQRSLSRLRDFHDELLQEHQRILSGEKSLLCHMKELWTYQLPLFTNWQSYVKPLRKLSRLSEYQQLVDRLFHQESLTDGAFSPSSL